MPSSAHLGDGGEDDDEEEDDSSEGAYTMEEVAKHKKKDDVWVVFEWSCLERFKFLSRHPGGELAILTFAGKDATAEFDMREVHGRIRHDTPFGRG